LSNQGVERDIKSAFDDGVVVELFGEKRSGRIGAGCPHCSRDSIDFIG
jgi:hypothetical protein